MRALTSLTILILVAAADAQVAPHTPTAAWRSIVEATVARDYEKFCTATTEAARGTLRNDRSFAAFCKSADGRAVIASLVTAELIRDDRTALLLVEFQVRDDAGPGNRSVSKPFGFIEVTGRWFLDNDLVNGLPGHERREEGH